MAYEIDFMPVGDGSKSGDAIAMRFGNLASVNEQSVVILDGGTKESGQKLVEHVKSYYSTNVVNNVICTHSDADHASGLTEVLEGLTVKRLLMHLPWNHVADLEGQLSKASASDKVRQHFKKSLESARQLEALARKKGIPIYEPFSGPFKPSDTFVILGPSQAYYEQLLASFRCVDELPLVGGGLLEKVFRKADGAIRWLRETWSSESLVEPGEDDCSAENNSSVVLLFREGGHSFLFTSDAGVPALTRAADHAQQNGINLADLTGGIQVPHHGSKRNVGPAILDRILGPKLEVQSFRRTAVISAAVDGAPKHPSKRVVNALMRRGCRVLATQGTPLGVWGLGAPRAWPAATPLPFYNEVEE
jgi:beta-lactamase superfamily II metal-dependent hydrolase